MAEEESAANPISELEEKKVVVENSFTNLVSSFKAFFTDRFSILDNAQPEQTIEGISKDVEFKGFNLWILIIAILIASAGLNANSTAVVIGAMLISPLMGPIMGLGLSVGIYDHNLLKRSLRNLGIAVVVSILTSTLFFLIIPLSDASSEILARTKPDIRDVVIAFFGGFAGILAGSRREKNNVIPGVAIATALMPPLCTAGYGLATLQLTYFLGAAYLFLINAFFIALATVLVTKYLRFPLKTFINAKTQRKGRVILAFTVLVMLIPASIIFIDVVKDAIYLRNVNQFIDDNIKYGETSIVKKDIVITDSTSYVNLVIFGETIPLETIDNWQRQLNNTVEKTKLRIFQGTDQESLPEVDKLVDMYTQTQSEIANKEVTISSLEEAVKKYQAEAIPISLLEEIKINYPEVLSIKMGRMVEADFSANKTKTMPNFFVWWEPTMTEEKAIDRRNQLELWLKTRLTVDSVEVISIKP